MSPEIDQKHAVLHCNAVNKYEFDYWQI